MLSYFQAIVMGVLQGISELFPVSSLGHSVLLPSLVGWHDLARAQAQKESFFLGFLVVLHCATALALILFFWRDWVRIVGAFFRSIKERKIDTPDARLAWLLVVATIPAGLTGVLLEHTLRTIFAKPLYAAIFLMLNGLLLFAGERLRRRSEVRRLAAEKGLNDEDARRLDTLEFKEAGAIGVAQIGALFAGISRSGITMVAGLVRGLDHEDAARFSFLLATPIILAAGVYKLHDFLNPKYSSIRGAELVGALFAGIAAFAAVKFLVKFFETRTLTPFALYCLVFGAAMTIRFA